MQEAALFTAACVVYFVTVTFFPGYPPEDAEGFIRNGAAGAKYIGARKAYAVYNQEALPAFGRFVTAYRAVPAAMPCSYSTVPAAFRPSFFRPGTLLSVCLSEQADRVFAAAAGFRELYPKFRS